MLQIKSQKALKDVDHTKYIFWPQRNKVRNQLTSKTKTGKKKKSVNKSQTGKFKKL